MKFLIDECLSPLLANLAWDAGYVESAHISRRDMDSWRDNNIMTRILIVPHQVVDYVHHSGAVRTGRTAPVFLSVSLARLDETGNATTPGDTTDRCETSCITQVCNTLADLNPSPGAVFSYQSGFRVEDLPNLRVPAADFRGCVPYRRNFGDCRAI